MPGPRLADYLETRERELDSQISNIRGHLGPLEAELAQVRKIRSLIADARAAGLTDLASDAVLSDPPAGTTESALRALQSINEPRSSLEVAAEQLTIKQMILRALRDHFDAGATPKELSEYMGSAFNKGVDRNSISPQLTRLREEGMVDMLNDGKWKLSQHGRGIMRYGYAEGVRNWLDEAKAATEAHLASGIEAAGKASGVVPAPTKSRGKLI